jgi:hypothetical protein
LGFEELPDYNFLRELFNKVLKNGGNDDDSVFDWKLLNDGKGWEVSHIIRIPFFLFAFAPFSFLFAFNIVHPQRNTCSLDSFLLYFDTHSLL